MIQMIQFDDMMLGWLAREVRFSISIFFAPKTPIGYQIKRTATLTRKPEPLFSEWMERTHGISSRTIQKKESIEKIIEILTPVRELVYDKTGMDKMIHTIETHPRLWNHDDVLRFVLLMDKTE